MDKDYRAEERVRPAYAQAIWENECMGIGLAIYARSYDKLLGFAAALFAMTLFLLSTLNYASAVAVAEDELARGHWSSVKTRLARLQEKKFCYELNHWPDAAESAQHLHNTIASIYNKARPASTEPVLPAERTPVTKADIAGLLFTAHINPWLECTKQFGIRDASMRYGSR